MYFVRELRVMWLNRCAAQGRAATERAAGCVQGQPAREGSARPGPHLRRPAGHGARLSAAQSWKTQVPGLLH